MWCRFVAVMTLALTSLCPAPGQDLYFERLSSELGLSQNMITCLMQDQKGFLWAGTKDGLNRFDGYRFKVYRHDPFDSTTISSNFVNNVLQDRQGRIWVSTFKGLNLFDPEKEVFHRIFPGMAGGDGLASEKILNLFLDSRGRIWLNTDDFNLHLLEMPNDSYDVRDLAIRRISHMKNDADSLVQVKAVNVLQDKTGVFWMYSPSGLFRFREESSGKSFSISKNFPEAENQTWQQTLEDLDDEANRFFRMGAGRNGGIWIGTDERLGYWDAGSGAWQLYPMGTNVAIQWNEVFEIMEDSRGEVWVSSINGLLTFKPGARKFNWKASENNPGFPLRAGGGPLLEDKGGLIWIGTKGYGLLKHNRHARRFEGRKNGSTSNFVYKGQSLRALCQLSDGNIWVSSSDKGLFQYQPLKGQIEPVGISAPVLREESVFSILEDDREIVWLGTSKGLCKIEGWKSGAGKVTGHYLPGQEVDMPKYNYVWKVIAGRDGALWMVSSANLCRFDPEKEKFSCYPYLPEKNLTILNNEFPTLFQDVDGLLWIGASEGLLRFDPVSRTFRHFQNDPKNPSSLSQNVVKAIAADPEAPGRFIWIGTSGGGLARFDKETETFKSFTEKDGLPDMVIYAILPDDAGNLWLSTNKGLSVFLSQKEKFRNFTEKDGLQDLEFNSGSYYRSPKGQLFFGGINGFNAFFPKEMLETNRHLPPAVFTDFRVSNKSVSLRDPRSVLHKEISFSDLIVLNHSIKIISFEFAALDFSDPSQNQFACMMEGFDEGWQYLGATHSATYTNLDAGTYTFRVKASNNDGEWNETGTSLKVVVRRPWWGAWWALTIYALLIGGVLAAFLQLQNKRNQDKAEATRLKLMNETKSAFLSTVSHEFRTPLTSIMGFSKIIKKRMSDRLLPLLDMEDPKIARTANQVMQNLDIVVSESERLTSLINQVLDLAKIEAGKVEWHDEVIEIAEVLDRGISATASLFTEKRLPLILEVEKGLPPVFGDKDRLVQVVINLLANSVKFTEKGKVRCWARKQDDMILVCVEDTGTGIREKDIHQIFEKFKQIGDDTLTDKPKGTGLGLPICKEIVERHGGKIWVESIFGKGSAFYLSLPPGHGA